MEPSDERRIERFVRDPESMPERQRRETRCLIEEDPGARAYAEFLRGIYDRLEGESLTRPSDRVDEFVEEVFSEEETNSAVPLRPFQHRGDPRPTVLAAETRATEARAPSEKRRFSVLTTLEAEAEDLLVRVLEDRDTGQGRVYVLAEPPERRACALVSFPGLGLDLATDEEGCREFDMPPGISQEQWDRARAVVRRPVAERAVGPEEEIVVSLPDGSTLQGERDGEMLRVALEPRGRDVPSRLTIAPPGRPARLFRLDTSSPLERDTSLEGPLVLRVYE